MEGQMVAGSWLLVRRRATCSLSAPDCVFLGGASTSHRPSPVCPVSPAEDFSLFQPGQQQHLAVLHVAAPCWSGGQQRQQARLQPRLGHLAHLDAGEQGQRHYR